MTDHARAKAALADIVAGLDRVTPGPWQYQNGCSWTRVGAPHSSFSDGSVLAPTIARDGHPDLTCGPGQNLEKNLQHIARCDPDTMSAIAAYVADLEAENERLLRSLATISSFADPEHMDPDDYCDGFNEWGLDDRSETVEMAYENVLCIARAAMKQGGE